jgi:signal transduction histidine kinase
MVVFRDITAMRAHEADLAAFAGVVAHDLKTPLATIASYAELAEEEIEERLPGPEGVSARTSLLRISASVRRAGQLVDDLLAFTTARDAAIHPETVDLDAMVEEVIAERTGTLGPDVPPPRIAVGALGQVHADPAMLRRVLDNLVGNALKYVPPGQPARIEISASPDGLRDWVRLDLADRGIGIPEDEKPYVFQPFHRARAHARYTGTGLGLAICRRVVERHGGRITIADNPGGGTRFRLTLPMPGPVADSALEVQHGSAQHAGEPVHKVR